MTRIRTKPDAIRQQAGENLGQLNVRVPVDLIEWITEYARSWNVSRNYAVSELLTIARESLES